MEFSSGEASFHISHLSFFCILCFQKNLSITSKLLNYWQNFGPNMPLLFFNVL